MRGDSSPYSTVHQVFPGGHVQEAVQGELVSEQLENRIIQVWLIHRVSNTKTSFGEEKKKHKINKEFTLEIVS